MYVLFCRNKECRSFHEDVKMWQKKLAIIKIISLIIETIMVWISVCLNLVLGCRVICRLCETLGTCYLVVRCELWRPLTTEQQGPVSDSWWTTAIWPATWWSCKHTLVHPCLMLLYSPHDELEYPEKLNPKYTPPPIICWCLLHCQSIGKVWKPSLKWITWHRKTGRRSQVEVEGTRDTLETGLFWYLSKIA